MVNKTLQRVMVKIVLVSVSIATIALYSFTSYSLTPDLENIKNLLERECTTLNKDKLFDLLNARFSSELENGLSPDFLRIMEGVIKRTDFDSIAEEKTVELIGLVDGAHRKGASLEFLDDIFDVAYVNTVSVDQLYAAAIALKEFDNSDVPQDVYEEFVYHSIENGWDPATMPTFTRGLIYGTDRGLSPQKVALIIMLDVKNGELNKKSPDQLVLDSIKLVREKEPQSWKPMTEVEKETAARKERKRTLEKKQKDIDDVINQKERAIIKAESELKSLWEQPAEKAVEVDVEKINRDMQELISSLQAEISKYQQQRGNVVAELETTRKAVEKQQAIKDRERRDRRDRDRAQVEQNVAAHGKKGRLNRYKLNASVDRYIGIPYRFGGDSERGIDCSAFTRRVYRDQGVELPRNSREQAQVGSAVSYNSVTTGDLIFFDASIQGRISHVGVYLGNNVFAHASSSKGVTKSSLREKYYVKRFVKGGRIFND